MGRPPLRRASEYLVGLGSWAMVVACAAPPTTTTAPIVVSTSPAARETSPASDPEPLCRFAGSVDDSIPLLLPGHEHPFAVATSGAIEMRVDAGEPPVVSATLALIGGNLSARVPADRPGLHLAHDHLLGGVTFVSSPSIVAARRLGERNTLTIAPQAGGDVDFVTEFTDNVSCSALGFAPPDDAALERLLFMSRAAPDNERYLAGSRVEVRTDPREARVWATVRADRQRVLVLSRAAGHARVAIPLAGQMLVGWVRRPDLTKAGGFVPFVDVPIYEASQGPQPCAGASRFRHCPKPIVVHVQQGDRVSAAGRTDAPLTCGPATAGFTEVWEPNLAMVDGARLVVADRDLRRCTPAD